MEKHGQTAKKRLRIFFPQDHSTFISKPLEKDDILKTISWVMEDRFSVVENDRGEELIITKSLLDRVTVTLQDEL